MNYEEYAERMKKQHRKPVEIEHYEDCVERAYMALGEVDKDEFCGLSDKTIAAIGRLARRVEQAEQVQKNAVQKMREFEERLDKTSHELDETKKQLDGTEQALLDRNELLESLVADMTPRDIVQALLAR